jgi:hypothetical protein
MSLALPTQMFSGAYGSAMLYTWPRVILFQPSIPSALREKVDFITAPGITPQASIGGGPPKW